jgi:hypothetical protein
MRRYRIPKYEVASMEEVERFIRSNILKLENGIIKAGEDSFLLLVEEEEWNEKGGSLREFRPIPPSTPLATAEMRSPGAMVAFRRKALVYPLTSHAVPVEERGESEGDGWGTRRWRKLIIFDSIEGTAEEITE